MLDLVNTHCTCISHYAMVKKNLFHRIRVCLGAVHPVHSGYYAVANEWAQGAAKIIHLEVGGSITKK